MKVKKDEMERARSPFRMRGKPNTKSKGKTHKGCFGKPYSNYVTRKEAE